MLDNESCSSLLMNIFEYPEGKQIKNTKGKLADKLNALWMKIS